MGEDTGQRQLDFTADLLGTNPLSCKDVSIASGGELMIEREDGIAPGFASDWELLCIAQSSEKTPGCDYNSSIA